MTEARRAPEAQGPFSSVGAYQDHVEAKRRALGALQSPNLDFVATVLGFKDIAGKEGEFEELLDSLQAEIPQLSGLHEDLDKAISLVEDIALFRLSEASAQREQDAVGVAAQAKAGIIAEAREQVEPKRTPPDLIDKPLEERLEPYQSRGGLVKVMKERFGPEEEIEKQWEFSSEKIKAQLEKKLADKFAAALRQESPEEAIRSDILEILQEYSPRELAKQLKQPDSRFARDMGRVVDDIVAGRSPREALARLVDQLKEGVDPDDILGLPPVEWGLEEMAKWVESFGSSLMLNIEAVIGRVYPARVEMPSGEERSPIEPIDVIRAELLQFVDRLVTVEVAKQLKKPEGAGKELRTQIEFRQDLLRALRGPYQLGREGLVRKWSDFIGLIIGFKQTWIGEKSERGWSVEKAMEQFREPMRLLGRDILAIVESEDSKKAAKAHLRVQLADSGGDLGQNLEAIIESGDPSTLIRVFKTKWEDVDIGAMGLAENPDESFVEVIRALKKGENPEQDAAKLIEVLSGLQFRMAVETLTDRWSVGEIGKEAGLRQPGSQFADGIREIMTSDDPATTAKNVIRRNWALAAAMAQLKDPKSDFAGELRAVIVSDDPMEAVRSFREKWRNAAIVNELEKPDKSFIEALDLLKRGDNPKEDVANLVRTLCLRQIRLGLWPAKDQIKFRESLRKVLATDDSKALRVLVSEGVREMITGLREAVIVKTEQSILRRITKAVTEIRQPQTVKTETLESVNRLVEASFARDLSHEVSTPFTLAIGHEQNIVRGEFNRGDVSGALSGFLRGHLTLRNIAEAVGANILGKEGLTGREDLYETQLAVEPDAFNEMAGQACRLFRQIAPGRFEFDESDFLEAARIPKIGEEEISEEERTARRHLLHVLWNLMENAVLHSRKIEGTQEKPNKVIVERGEVPNSIVIINPMPLAIGGDLEKQMLLVEKIRESLFGDGVFNGRASGKATPRMGETILSGLTTEYARQGLGLGLTIARILAAKLGLEIEYEIRGIGIIVKEGKVFAEGGEVVATLRPKREEVLVRH